MKQIKLIRMKNGLNQSELAELLGVTQGVISSWENGQYTPSVKNAFELARVLGCTVDELFADRENPQGVHDKNETVKEICKQR